MVRLLARKIRRGPDRTDLSWRAGHGLDCLRRALVLDCGLFDAVFGELEHHRNDPAAALACFGAATTGIRSEDAPAR